MKGDRRKLAETFGGVLRDARDRAGRSQEEVGRAAGLVPCAVSHAENGVRLPSLGTLLKIASGLGVPAADLVAELERRQRGRTQARPRPPA